MNDRERDGDDEYEENRKRRKVFNKFKIKIFINYKLNFLSLKFNID